MSTRLAARHAKTGPQLARLVRWLATAAEQFVDGVANVFFVEQVAAGLLQEALEGRRGVDLHTTKRTANRHLDLGNSHVSQASLGGELDFEHGRNGLIEPHGATRAEY